MVARCFCSGGPFQPALETQPTTGLAASLALPPPISPFTSLPARPSPSPDRHRQPALCGSAFALLCSAACTALHCTANSRRCCFRCTHQSSLTSLCFASTARHPKNFIALTSHPIPFHPPSSLIIQKGSNFPTTTANRASFPASSIFSLPLSSPSCRSFIYVDYSLRFLAVPSLVSSSCASRFLPADAPDDFENLFAPSLLTTATTP
jgi:hypothetical protein